MLVSAEDQSNALFMNQFVAQPISAALATIDDIQNDTNDEFDSPMLFNLPEITDKLQGMNVFSADHSDYIGLLSIELTGARNLPAHSS